MKTDGSIHAMLPHEKAAGTFKTRIAQILADSVERMMAKPC